MHADPIQNEINKIWPLLGFSLRNAIHEGRTTVKES